MRDAKIPDHEKLPKTCIYYKHYMQVDANSKVIDAARSRIKEDKELLHEIAHTLSTMPSDKKADDDELNTDLVKLR